MKSILIIGLGRFGSHLCMNFSRLDNEIMIVDQNETKLEDLLAYVVSKANRDIHAKFLLRNGADEVIYPDRDIADKVAVRFSANQVFDYVELDNGFSIYEIAPLPEWLGRSLKEVNMRVTYQTNSVSKHPIYHH